MVLAFTGTLLRLAVDGQTCETPRDDMLTQFSNLGFPLLAS
jgi:hypothetical protein